MEKSFPYPCPWVRHVSNITSIILVLFSVGSSLCLVLVTEDMHIRVAQSLWVFSVTLPSVFITRICLNVMYLGQPGAALFFLSQLSSPGLWDSCLLPGVRRGDLWRRWGWGGGLKFMTLAGFALVRELNCHSRGNILKNIICLGPAPRWTEVACRKSPPPRCLRKCG